MPDPTPELPFGNRACGRAIVAFFLREGVRQFFLSPGARSAPIAAALAELAPDLVVAHYDERGMGFCALGSAIASGVPSVCLVTSGTAAANLHPAVIEADQSEIPMILLTADRPAALRGTGSNQTIDQAGMFGRAVRGAWDLPAPPRMGITPRRFLEETLAAALRCACGEHAGPVQLNFQFDEPLLAPDSTPVRASPHGRPVVEDTPENPEEFPPGEFFESRRGVVVLGQMPPLRTASEREVVFEFAEQLGWPVIADGLSGFLGDARAVSHADFLLRLPGTRPPGAVLHLGGRLVSRHLAEWISKCPRGSHWQVRKTAGRYDPHRVHPSVIRADPQRWCSCARAAIPPFPRGLSYHDAWLNADRKAAACLRRELESQSLSEPLAARIVAEFASENSAPLFLGNSMPVRDFTSFCGPLPAPPAVYGNRGASGIDGNIATASGIGMALKSPPLLLLGDLTALHDLNSLPLLARAGGRLVILNNSGGGIFQFLPLDLPAAARERFLETPHPHRFGHAAAQFGLEYSAPASPDCLRKALACPGPRVVEIRTDRDANFALHQKITREVAALGISFPE